VLGPAAPFSGQLAAAGAWPHSGTLPPRLRPDARLGCLDVTKYFGTTSGGIKTYLQEKGRFVATRPEYRQVMVIPGSDDQVVTDQGSRTYRLKGPRIPACPPYRFLLATRTFRSIVEHERPEVIEVGSPFLVPWLTRYANRRLGAVMTWYYHGHLPRISSPDPTAAGPLRRIGSRALGRYVRFLGDRFPTVICGSSYAARELAELGVERISVAPLGVDLVTFHPRRRGWADETRRAAGLPPGLVALFAGRFAAEKRLDVVLDAWPAVERATGMRLALLGAGPLEPRLRAHPWASRVTWLAYQSQRDRFADLLAAADILVAPGPFETFGLTVLEALASGTPVLTVDSGGGAELVTRSGAGARYQLGSAESAAAAAVELAGRDRQSLGKLGREFAERHHAWPFVLERLFEVYRSLVELTRS
jgi:alpha-1,6-mannosyltransferase